MLNVRCLGRTSKASYTLFEPAPMKTHTHICMLTYHEVKQAEKECPHNWLNCSTLHLLNK